jgi:hypothetical protein
MALMPREGAIIFRDLVGKLEVLNVECAKSGRRGRYRLDRLIDGYGIDARRTRSQPTARASERRTIYAGRDAQACQRVV